MHLKKITWNEISVDVEVQYKWYTNLSFSKYNLVYKTDILKNLQIIYFF